MEPHPTDTPGKQPSKILRTLHLVPIVYVCVQAPEIPPYYGQTAVAGFNIFHFEEGPLCPTRRYMYTVTLLVDVHHIQVFLQ